MQKQINLEEILKSYLTVEAMRVNNPDYTFNMVLSAMKDACKQTLELAAENATEDLSKHNMSYHFNIDSILDTIKQIK